jgi:hypothetical protein
MIKDVKKILKVFADNNLFAEGVELIGSWCFQLYQSHLGVQSFPLRTQDIDFLIPNPFQGKVHPDLIKQLEDLGFTCDFNRDGSMYLWNAELKIEFLTPEKGRGSNRSIKIKKLGLNAIPSRFTGVLLNNPLVITAGGIKILIPNPANFCLHKLIVASRRRKIDKILKDLQQAIYTAAIVDENEIQELFRSLPKKWKQIILNMLEKANKEFPLLTENINKLELTLQNSE